MSSHRLSLSAPQPYFAELPYYLWGQINYDSEGDSQKPAGTCARYGRAQRQQRDLATRAPGARTGQI